MESAMTSPLGLPSVRAVSDADRAQIRECMWVDMQRQVALQLAGQSRLCDRQGEGWEERQRKTLCTFLLEQGLIAAVADYLSPSPIECMSEYDARVSPVVEWWHEATEQVVELWEKLERSEGDWSGENAARWLLFARDTERYCSAEFGLPKLGHELRDRLEGGGSAAAAARLVVDLDRLSTIRRKVRLFVFLIDGAKQGLAPVAPEALSEHRSSRAAERDELLSWATSALLKASRVCDAAGREGDSACAEQLQRLADTASPVLCIDALMQRVCSSTPLFTPKGLPSSRVYDVPALELKEGQVVELCSGFSGWPSGIVVRVDDRLAHVRVGSGDVVAVPLLYVRADGSPSPDRHALGAVQDAIVYYALLAMDGHGEGRAAARWGRYARVEPMLRAIATALWAADTEQAPWLHSRLMPSGISPPCVAGVWEATARVLVDLLPRYIVALWARGHSAAEGGLHVYRMVEQTLACPRWGGLGWPEGVERARKPGFDVLAAAQVRAIAALEPDKLLLHTFESTAAVVFALHTTVLDGSRPALIRASLGEDEEMAVAAYLEDLHVSGCGADLLQRCGTDPLSLRLTFLDRRRRRVELCALAKSHESEPAAQLWLQQTEPCLTPAERREADALAAGGIEGAAFANTDGAKCGPLLPLTGVVTDAVSDAVGSQSFTTSMSSSAAAPAAVGGCPAFGGGGCTRPGQPCRPQYH